MSPATAKHLPPLPPIKQSWIMPILRAVMQWSPATAQRHYALGQEFLQQGKLWEAEQRWKWVIGLRPTHVQALIGLGEIWLEQGRVREATLVLRRALALQPKQPEARYLLAMATTSQQPQELLPLTTPPRLLQRRYAPVSEYYTQYKLVEEGYSAASEISVRLLQALKPITGKWRVLDMGCGSGLVGEMLWRSQPHLEGVDAVARMLQQARPLLRISERQRKKLIELEALRDNGVDMIIPPELRKPRPIYNALWNEDIRDFLLRPRAPSFHAIIACEVFADIGGLAPVFDGVARNLLPGGMLICTTDVGPENGYSAYGSDVRFAHSEAYLNEQAARVGLELVEHEIAPRSRKDTVRYSVFYKPVS